MLKDFFQGRVSPAIIYWVGFVIISQLVFVSLNYGLFLWEMNTVWNEPAISFRYIRIACFAVCTIYLIILARAMFKAMYFERRPSFWTWLGLALICFGIFRTVFVIYQVAVPSAFVSAAQIRKEYNMIRIALPNDLGNGVQLVDVSFANSTLDHRYRVAGDSYGLTGKDLFSRADVAELCSDMEGYMKSAVDRLQFVYQYDDAELTRVITKQECTAALE